MTAQAHLKSSMAEAVEVALHVHETLLPAVQAQTVMQTLAVIQAAR